MSETASSGGGVAPGPALRVLVVDDHRLFRGGLRDVLEESGIAIAGEADSGEEALELAPALSPDVVIMDLTLPGISGAEATRRLLAAEPKLTVLVLTVSAEGGDIDEALAAGARGYLLKDAEASEVVRAIQAAARGEAPLDPRVARAVLARGTTPAALSGMTAREREVLGLLGTGLPNKAIARQLGISEATVKAHLTRIFRQIGVSDRTQAAIWARDHRVPAP
jgi:DNA-binding NarL/FixJ family response regulator